MLRYPCVFFIQGSLGVGKTTLLKRFARNAENQKLHNIIYLDLSKILGDVFRTRLPGSSLSGIQGEVACQVIQALAQQIPAKRTLDSIQKRSNLSLDVAYDSEIRALLTRLGGNTLLNIGFKALTEGFKTVPVVGSLLDTAYGVLPKKEIQQTLIDVVTRRIRHEEALLLFNPLKVLTDDLIEDLEILANSEEKIVVLVDDLREDLSLLKNWFFRLLSILPEGLDASWFFSTWGQRDSTWASLNWDFTERRVHRLEYSVVEDIVRAQTWEMWKMMRHFPAQISPPPETYTSLGPVNGKEPDLVESIAAQGSRLDFLPLILAEADNHHASDRQCCEALGDHLKRWLVDPQHFDWVRNLAVTRVLDREIVDYLVDNPVESNCWQHLVTVGKGRFLIPRGDRYTLQSELRYALLRYTQIQHSMRGYFDLHGKMADFYRDKISAFPNNSEHEIGLLLPHRLLSPWEWYVEWFYHGLSASARPGAVLLDGLQRALFHLAAPQQLSRLIDVIYQVADERHSEKGFLTDPIPFPISTTRIGRASGIPQSYEREFRKWGEMLEECLQEVQNPHGADWNSIVNFFDTFIDLSRLDPDCISPRAAAEALLWRALAAYEMREKDPAPEDHLEDIIELSESHEDLWWKETRTLADVCQRGLEDTGYWQWDQFP